MPNEINLSLSSVQYAIAVVVVFTYL